MTPNGPPETLREHVRLHPPEVAVVLGSGLGSIAARVQPAHSFCYSLLPMLTTTTVDGHGGRLILGTWAGRSVLLFAGRVHFYEGHSWDRVLGPIRLAASWGVKKLVLTNASGGIRDDLTPGSLLAIRAHLNCTRPGLWPSAEVINGTTPYSANLRTMLTDAAAKLGFALTQGIYAAVLGPNYETPAEIRALRALGADAVGMSTACEIEAAAALGLECAAISCVTNRAAGLSATPLSHKEVLFHSERQATRLGDLLEQFLLSVT
jgi:purine-nucleoside phosphorylase